MDIAALRKAAANYWRHNEYELKEYVIRDGKKHPFALICPGGGYTMVCSHVEGEPFAERLNALGYSAFVLFYRCRDKARYPAPMEDLARALKDILSRAEELQVETEGYSVWGSSAGGHLAASFGTEAMGYPKFGLPMPGTLVLCYPVITMGEKTHAGSRRNLLGKNPPAELIELTCVEKQVTGAYPPCFVWCGDVDRVVDPENSRNLALALQENAVPYRFTEYPGVDHGVGLGQGLACEGWLEDAVDFWQQQTQKD